MMTRLFRMVFVALVALSLSACGSILGAFLPDVPVDDAFGVDGVALQLSESTLAGVAALQAAPQVFAGEWSDTVEIGESDAFDDVPEWIVNAVKPKSVSGGVGIATFELTLAAPGDAWPETITIVGAGLAIDVSRGGTTRYEGSWVASDLSLALAASGSCDLTSTTCSYSFDSSVQLLALRLSGSAATAYGNVASTPGTYEVEGEFYLELLSDPALGALTSVDVELKAFPGLITF